MFWHNLLDDHAYLALDASHSKVFDRDVGSAEKYRYF